MAIDRKLKKLSILTKLNKLGAVQPIKHALSALPIVGKPISLGVDLAL